MSNPFEKIRQDQLKKKQAQDAKEAEITRQSAQARQKRRQAAFRYNELVMSVLCELEATLYSGWGVQGPIPSGCREDSLGDYNDYYVVSWNIAGYRNLPNRTLDRGVYVCLIFDPGSSSTCFDQNAHPICFECVVQQHNDFNVAPKIERTRGLTRQELTEVLARMHS